MDYEKKYKEALDQANVIHKSIRSDLKQVIEQIFPELKESEDEKIRKSLIEFLEAHKKDKPVIAPTDTQINKWIAILEKQGEQKPVELEEPNFFDDFRHSDCEQKEEWSEEDKAMLKVAIAICNRYSHQDVANWLKSLRPQNLSNVERNGKNWKPSEKQMEALKQATYCQEHEMSDILFELYKQLKAL